MALFGDFGKAIGGVLGLSKGRGETISNPYAPQQDELIARLKERAFGNGPSIAEMQSRQNMGQVLSDQVSAIRSTPGLNPALQARLANQAGQQAATETAQQGAMAKLAEQDANVGQLTSALFGASNQNINKQQAEGQAENARNNRFAQVLGGAGSAIASMSATSDEDEKEKISESGGEARDLISQLKGKLYEYKDNGNGEGVHVGIMAQDLEKSPLGKSMVFEENGVKKVDYAKGFGAMLAAMAEIDEKLSAIEGKGKK